MTLACPPGTNGGTLFDFTEHYTFNATHRMTNLPRKHPAATVHLHRWTVVVTLRSSDLPPPGRQSETAELEPLRSHIANELDGKYLNDIWPIAATPSTVSEHLLSWCQGNLDDFARSVLDSVAVSITASSAANCAPWRMSGCRVRR